MREKWRAVFLPFENDGFWKAFSRRGTKILPAYAGVSKVNGLIFQNVVRGQYVLIFKTFARQSITPFPCPVYHGTREKGSDDMTLALALALLSLFLCGVGIGMSVWALSIAMKHLGCKDRQNGGNSGDDSGEVRT